MSCSGKSIGIGVRSVSNHLLVCHLGQWFNLSEHSVKWSWKSLPCWVVWRLKERMYIEHLSQCLLHPRCSVDSWQVWMVNQFSKETGIGTSLVAQWLRICLPMEGTRVQALVREDPTCCRATKSVRHNYWACALEPTSHNYWSQST